MISRRTSPIAVCTSCTAAVAVTPALRFSVQTSAAGIENEFNGGNGSGAYGGGVAGDFDRDGWQDFYVPGDPSRQDRLFINNRDGTFSDEAAEWGMIEDHLGLGAAAGDFNSDGWLDLFVTSDELIGILILLVGRRQYAVADFGLFRASCEAFSSSLRTSVQVFATATPYDSQ